MSTLRIAARLVARLAVVLGSAALAADQPGLGQPITRGDLAPWDISIVPDGAGLPPGSGTPVQGKAVFQAKCEACHGEERQRRAQAPSSPRAARAQTIANFWPYATTIFDFIRRAMPGSTEIAYQRGNLRADRLYPVAEQADRRERRDQCRNAPEGAHAQPGRLRQQVPGQALTSRPEEFHLRALPGRVEDWRAGLGRCSCCLLSRLSSASVTASRPCHVSSPRHVERSVRISRLSFRPTVCREKHHLFLRFGEDAGAATGLRRGAGHGRLEVERRMYAAEVRRGVIAALCSWGQTPFAEFVLMALTRVIACSKERGLDAAQASLAALFLLAISTTIALAQPGDDFYRSRRNIELISPSESGSAYTLWARLVARYIRTTCPENQP